VVALAISFLCSILDAVLLSISHSYMVVLQECRHPAARVLAEMRENIDEPTAATLPERYLATHKHANAVDPTGRLRCILALARYIGRRESAICSLYARKKSPAGVIARRALSYTMVAVGLEPTTSRM
jgi:hypothetical protein